MPPALTFADRNIDAAIATLEANLPAAIAAFNADPENADLQLEEPVAYIFGADDPLGSAGFPIIEVSAVGGRTGTFALEQAEFDHNPRLNVVAWHESGRGEVSTAHRRSLAFGRVMLAVLLQPGAFGELADVAGFEWRDDLVPADITDDGREFRKWHVPFFAQFTIESVERLTG